MKTMTSRERFQRMYAHQEADRIPIIDSPWAATIERWQREGMPADVHYTDFFDLDRTGHIGVDNSPRYPERLIEETDAYTVRTSNWGVTQRTWKHAASTPEFIDFTVVDRASWEQAKARMTPADDRINWDYLRVNYPRWKEQGRWIEAGLWFGFDITHSWFVGTERLLCALLDDPDWCRDMFSHELELDLALLDRAWDAGYRFDCVGWPDDLGYKGSQFFSLDLYREVLKPFHQRAIDWAHAKGAKVHLHSCGDVRPYVPEWVAMGFDALNPLEVKAGMDPLALKREFGDRLVLHGGVNAVLWDKPAEICAEMERVIPTLKTRGGYIFSSDHSVPSSVSLHDFREIVTLAKRLGSYG
jgi:uroporphyrinogen decarboxylase